MAKRVAPDEKPYRPVDEALVRSVLSPPAAPTGTAAPPPNGNEPTPNGNGVAPPTDHMDASSPAVASEWMPLASPLSAAPWEPEGAVALSPAPQPEPAPALEKLTREKRLLVTPSEDLDLERLVVDLTERLGTHVKLSHVFRATVTLLRRARPELLQESERVGPLKRPYNGDGAALIAFEQSLAQIIDTSLRNAGPLV